MGGLRQAIDVDLDAPCVAALRIAVAVHCRAPTCALLKIVVRDRDAEDMVDIDGRSVAR